MGDKESKKAVVNFLYVKNFSGSNLVLNKDKKGLPAEYYVFGATEEEVENTINEKHLCSFCSMDSFFKCPKVIAGSASDDKDFFEYDYNFILDMSHVVAVRESNILNRVSISKISKMLDSGMSPEEIKFGIYNFEVVQKFVEENEESVKNFIYDACSIFKIMIEQWRHDEFYPYISKDCFFNEMMQHNKMFDYDSKSFIVNNCTNFTKESQKQIKRKIK